MDERIHEIKIIVVGEANVGKTSLIKKYCWNKYEEIQVVLVYHI